jgi:hypothetical protein
MNCGNCHKCLEGLTIEVGIGKIPVTSTRMILCSICGNKRCPKASDHELACTGSNDTQQIGSVYSEINFKTLDE